MEYVATRRCRQIGATGEKLNIPYGTKLQTIGDFIATPAGKAICYTSSELAHRYFSRNDDGKGLERGKLAQAIAFGKREQVVGNRKQRFTESEIDYLTGFYNRFLVPGSDYLVFNNDFFQASPEELRPIARVLGITIKEDKQPCTRS